MTMQIRAIGIYSNDGELRHVKFELGKLNIVAGGSKTGKSALLDIVDYCWGRTECTVPVGEIRRSVSWFAVLFDRDGEGVLIARRNPPPPAVTDDAIYFERNVDELPPDASTLGKNITSDALRDQFASLLGIQKNLHVPPAGATRRPLEASAGQAILFCLQSQDEIANRRFLFHRQGEQWIPQAIKDVLPYFLGAVDEGHFITQKRLDEARVRLRRLERELADAAAIASEASEAASRLLLDAKRVGLSPTDASASSPEELRALLVQAAEARPALLGEVQDGSADMAELEERRRSLRVELEDLRDEIADVGRLAREASAFQTEAQEHEARLASIGLVSGSDDADHGTCPLCDSRLAAAVPSVADVRRGLESVSRQLQAVRRDSPRVQARLAELEQARSSKEAELRGVNADIASRIAENERLRIEQNNLATQARIVGRITYYLENARAVGVAARLPAEVNRVRAEVAELEKALDPEAVEERLATALSLVGKSLTEYAGMLKLEHGEHPLRLDRKNLTVVADAPEGPLALPQIGSGENWVGYHVAAHLALHKVLRARNRPVPAFLMLDQPSQAHYPRERDVGEVGGADDEDQAAVARLFRLLDDYCKGLTPAMQVIVMDHFELLEPWFRKATVERWRDGIKLVPLDWLR